MSKILKNYTFPRHHQRTGPYPWDTWLDGKVRELRQGVDFTSQTVSFRQYVYRADRARCLGSQAKVSMNKKVQLA